MTSNWYDLAHSGEGIVVQVAAFSPNADGSVSWECVFDWFTCDIDGNPIWISGSTTIDPGNPTQVTVPASSRSGGDFAGDFGANAFEIPWGSPRSRSPDRDHMTIDYVHMPPFDTPPVTGTLHYRCLLNFDGLGCGPNAAACPQ
ncbi:MAG: hypothetical protein WBV61_02205 [Rhodanobacteraceae bacterium]